MNNLNDEAIIKLVGKLTQEFPNIDQLKVRNIAEEVLYLYDVRTKETGLVASDITEKLNMFLVTKKIEGLSMETLENYNYQITIFASHLVKPLATITAPDIRVYLANRSKGMKPSTANNQISILKSFFKWLFIEEYIPRNPMDKVKAVKEPERVNKALPAEDIELLKQACTTDREKALLEFLISTGCRLSEVVKTNFQDIDWHERSLYVIGKGNKERKVYFSIKAKILLQKYLKLRKGSNEALFIGLRFPFNRLSGRGIQIEIEGIVEKAKLDKAVSPHSFRHSFATHSLNSGMSLPVLQKLMGHDSPDTTLIYAELDDEIAKHEHRKIS